MSKSISVSVRALMERMRAEQRAVTFDDVSLADAPSAVHPNDVGLGAHITRKYRVPVPLLGAAMDTVTEAELALELARCGGVGVLHRNLSAAEQARQLSWVRLKVHSGGMIEKPITFCTEDQLSTVEEALREHRWSFSTFPIVSNDGALAGILGRNEMAFASSASSANPRLSDLMKPIADIVHSRPCSAQEAQTLMREKRVRKLPIVGEDGGLAGLYVWKDVCAALRDSEAALDEEGHYLVGAAVSSAESDMARVDALMSAGCRILVLDSSHGASAEAVAQVKRIRARYSDVQIIVGNIASYNSARYILQETQGQVDALKIGIGPGMRFRFSPQARSAPRDKSRVMVCLSSLRCTRRGWRCKRTWLAAARGYRSLRTAVCALLVIW